MLGRAWVSVLLASLTGCASRSRLKPFSPNLMYRKIKNSFAASTALLPASGSVTLIYDECCRFRSDCIMQLSPASLQQNCAGTKTAHTNHRLPCRESRCESTY